MIDKKQIKNYKVFLIFFLIGILSISNFVALLKVSKKNAPLTKMDDLYYCVTSIFSSLSALPYYLAQLLPYFKQHNSLLTLTAIPIILYSIVFLLFYLVIGFILNKMHNKNKKLFKKVTIILIIILIILSLFYFYLGCFFELGKIEL